MKKILLTIAALGMLAAIATSAAAFELKVKGGWSAVTLGYGLKQDDTKNSTDQPAYTTLDAGTFVDNNGEIDFDKLTLTMVDTTAFYGYETGVDSEFDYKFDDKNVYSVAKQKQDIRPVFIVDLNDTIDALTGHALYFHSSGDNNATDTALNSYGSTGRDFEPLYILTGTFGNILNNYQGADTSDVGTAAQTAGVNAFVVSTDFSATQALNLHAALGYAMADKERAGWDNEYGFEYNIGAAYRLMDNLIYAVHLGYLDTGAFFKLGTKYTDTNDIFLVSQHLTMSF